MTTPHNLSSFEEAHARSIVEQPAELIPVPAAQRFKILVGIVVRKPPLVVQALLKTLGWQRLRAPLDVHFHFITDFPAGDPDAAPVLELLRAHAKSAPCLIEEHAGNPGQDYADGDLTRAWSNTAWHRVGALKDRILQRAVAENFDAVWLLDADVLCDPYTLQSMWDCDELIAAAVYWTHWQRPQYESGVLVHAGPQVWLRHPYRLDGHGYTEADFRAALLKRGKLRVWGLGACTLIRRHALLKGMSFARLGDLPPGPMSDGEDRHFCRRAEILHLPLFADAWPDIFHAYHPQAYADDIPRYLERLGAEHPERATFGDLVSAQVRNMEQPEVPPEWVRGRIGSLDVLPEIEEAITAMSPGDTRIIRAHFPVHYPLPPLRGQTRLLQVKLFDVKPFVVPPTIDLELLVGARRTSTMDVTTLTEAQIGEML